VVCGKDPYTPCTAVELMVFAKKQLREVLRGTETFQAMALACHIEDDSDVFACNANDEYNIQEYSFDTSITARALRRNLATKLYAETQASDIMIRLWMGHEQDIGTKLLNPYDEDDVWDMLQVADHRMILPQIHPGWYIAITKDTNVEINNASKQFISLSRDTASEGICLEIIMEGKEFGDPIHCDLKRLLPPEAKITIKTTYHKDRLSEDRVNTDHSHWPLPQWPKAEDHDI
jgi:hypothetical protein